jgi:probable F420-dependent oxidoreductase
MVLWPLRPGEECKRRRPANTRGIFIYMKIGMQTPNNSAKPREIGLTKMGRLAEDAGADSLWVNDHLLMVEGGRSPYPFTPDGAIPWPMDLPWYECLTAASFLAATTSRCRIGTSVLILPQRNVLELAKTTATLDALSGGRLILGIGVGWFAEEIEALGYRFETRGRRTDEMIEVLRRCWTGRPRAFEGGEIVVQEDLVFEPRPSQPNGPPILVGGMSRTALGRAGRAHGRRVLESVRHPGRCCCAAQAVSCLHCPQVRESRPAQA